MAKTKYRIGTRGSKLALAQTQQVIDLLRSFEPQADYSIEIITTRGEILADAPLSVIDAKGVFTKELEHALLLDHIDIAVHSAKDLPTDFSPGVAIAAYVARVDPREALVSHQNRSLTHLPHGAVVGTGSPRRRAQLAHLRSDLKFVNLRGNVDTRIRKIRAGECQATLLACAGLIRLGLMHEAAEIFPPDRILPAAGQGALALQCRHDDLHAFRLLEQVNHPPTAWSVMAEREVLKYLQAGCSYPLGVHAVYPHGYPADSSAMMTLRAVMFNPKTGQCARSEASDQAGRWHAVAETVARQLKSRSASAV